MVRAPVVLVSHLAADGQVTGAERSLLELGAGLRDRGWPLLWLSPRDGISVREARELGLRVEVLRWPRLFLASWEAGMVGSAGRALRFVVGAGALPKLRRWLAASGFRVALVNTLVNAGAAWAARRAGLRVVWRVAELPGPGPRARLFRSALLRYGDRVGTVSAAVAGALGVAGSHVIRTGVAPLDATRVAEARADLRQRLGLGEDAILVGHVAQLRPHKGQREFLRAALRVAAPPEVVYVIAGAEEGAEAYARELRALAAPLGPRARFAGYVGGAGRAVAALDVMAFTSIAPDPFPRAILEAMAAGVPVVAFSGGGVEEAVVDGRTGWVVPVGDEAALGRALGELLGDPGLRLRLGRAASERVVRELDRERMIDTWSALLEEAAVD